MFKKCIGFKYLSHSDLVCQLKLFFTVPIISAPKRACVINSIQIFTRHNFISYAWSWWIFADTLMIFHELFYIPLRYYIPRIIFLGLNHTSSPFFPPYRKTFERVQDLRDCNWTLYLNPFVTRQRYTYWWGELGAYTVTRNVLCKKGGKCWRE